MVFEVKCDIWLTSHASPFRDFVPDADQAMELLDPSFQEDDSAIFKEYKPQTEDPMKQQLATIDEQVSVLAQESRKAQYEADTLALARDLAQITSFYKEVDRGERAKRLEKVNHLRAQNTIGAAIVSEYMSNNLAVNCGVVKDQMNVANRAWGSKNKTLRGKIGMFTLKLNLEDSHWFLCPLKFLQRYPELPVVVWCDFMKCGRMTATEMDEYSSLLAHILHARYKACVALVIAPYLVSEKQEGYRGQLRTGRPW